MAFTYNDPVVFVEYALDVAEACRARGVKTVAVSAGYMCDAPRREFCRHIDAANIDLKGFTEAFYKKLCTGSLGAVLETLAYLKHETPVWLENHDAADSGRERLTCRARGSPDSAEERRIMRSLVPHAHMKGAHMRAF